MAVTNRYSNLQTVQLVATEPVKTGMVPNPTTCRDWLMYYRGEPHSFASRLIVYST